MSLAHYARTAQKRQRAAWKQARETTGQNTSFLDGIRDVITNIADSVSTYIERKQADKYFSQQNTRRLAEERRLFKQPHELTTQERELIDKVNQDLDAIPQEPKKELQQPYFDAHEQKEDPLLALAPTTQVYLLNQMTLGRDVDEQTLKRLTKHATTLAALAPEEHDQTLDAILEQPTSFKQGKGPLAILNDQDSSLHDAWLEAQKHPERATYDSPKTTREESQTEIEYVHKTPFSQKIERGVKAAAFASILGVSAIGLSHYLTNDNSAEFNQGSQTQEVSFEEQTVAVQESERIPLETLLEEYVPLSKDLLADTANSGTQEVESATVDYAFEPSVPLQTWSEWNQDYEGLLLTKDVTFADGQQLYKTFLDAGVPEDVAIASVEKTAIDNEWYSAERMSEDGLVSGENPLALDKFPRSGETYTLTLDATELVPEPAESTVEAIPDFESYTVAYAPQNGIGVLGALKEVIGDEELYKQASGASLIATGLENNLFPERCLTETGGFDGTTCRPALDIEPWFAGQEYDLVVTLPEEFSKENNYGGNWEYKIQ